MDEAAGLNGACETAYHGLIHCGNLMKGKTFLNYLQSYKTRQKVQNFMPAYNRLLTIERLIKEDKI